MSAPDEVGLVADAEALNLADEVRRILADGQPRTTRQVADLSRLTQGGDDVSKIIYLLRMRGELQTDVVDGRRLHRLIADGGPPPRAPAVPRKRAAPEDSARGRASHADARGSGAPPRMPETDARGSGAPPRTPATADDVTVSITDRGQLLIMQAGGSAIALDAQRARGLLTFLSFIEPLLERLAQADP